MKPKTGHRSVDTAPAGIAGDGPYAGLRVLDLSCRLSGAFAARLFGDFGADVVLAEGDGGHPLRWEPPFLDDQPGYQRSAVHAYVNWNKRSVVVRADAELDPMLAATDLVVTGDQGGLADPSGLAPRLRPGAVLLSISAHGLTSGSDSPPAPGTDLTLAAESGWCSINGRRNEAPLQMPGHQAGYIGGLAGFVAAAAALGAPAGAAPKVVEVSELEALCLTAHPWGVASAYELGAEAGREDRRSRRGIPGPLFQAADGSLSMAVAYFRQWPAAMAALGL